MTDRPGGRPSRSTIAITRSLNSLRNCAASRRPSSNSALIPMHPFRVFTSVPRSVAARGGLNQAQTGDRPQLRVAFHHELEGIGGGEGGFDDERFGTCALTLTDQVNDEPVLGLTEKQDLAAARIARMSRVYKCVW